MQNNQKIPEGWSVKKISDLGNVVSGGTPDTNNPEYWDGNVLWVTPSEVSTLSNRFISNTERKITEKGLKESSAKLLPINSLIICTRATIGDCCINKVPMCTNQGFKNIIVKNNNVDFLYYLITKNKNELIRKACGSTFLEISKKDIDNLKFAIPPLPEQEKIAGILGTWDEAIEKLSGLIEQKKLLKKGLMQRLLTGKTRLSGFTQPWKEVKLGEIAKKISDKNNENCSNIVTISAQNGFVNQDDYFNKFVSSDTLTNYYLLQKGDFGYNRSYSRGYPLGAIKKLNNHEKAVVSTLYICFRSLKDKINSIFLEQYFETGLLNKDLSKVAQEGARNHGLLNITLKDFFSVKLYIPTDIAEQQAIADVLSTADEKIDLLNKKLEVLKEQKKGLMQQLLTGQTRVKVNYSRHCEQSEAIQFNNGAL
ncbi:MAG: restriction endonuclease subunit S [Alphaproteobacteria bacterium]|nr:restriction endonuclease subunit S [Alphaproteobacteria bacterium]